MCGKKDHDDRYPRHIINCLLAINPRIIKNETAMPHTSAEPSQLAVVALFSKKEKEEICLCARSRREIYVSLPLGSIPHK